VPVGEVAEGGRRGSGMRMLTYARDIHDPVKMHSRLEGHVVDIYKWLFGARGKDAIKDLAGDTSGLLAPYIDEIAKTKRAMIAIGVEEDAPATAIASRLGGFPWWPAAKPYPRDAKGHPLFLLVQINFAETPPLDPFPRSGLLQIFIAADDLYGCDVENQRNSEGFACVYHEELGARALDEFSFVRVAKDTGYLPFEDPLAARALSFALDAMPVDASDYRFEKLLPEIAADEALTEAYWDYNEKPALRLGGYPTFTQTDPRSYPTGADFGDFTLLTVDTITGLMWGDSGVAQFFMHEGDLKRHDFSKVVYNWDCC
jgi:uncharacterized protein YwqG